MSGYKKFGSGAFFENLFSHFCQFILFFISFTSKKKKMSVFYSEKLRIYVILNHQNILILPTNFLRSVQERSTPHVKKKIEPFS